MVVNSGVLPQGKRHKLQNWRENTGKQDTLPGNSVKRGRKEIQNNALNNDVIDPLMTRQLHSQQ